SGANWTTLGAGSCTTLVGSDGAAIGAGFTGASTTASLTGPAGLEPGAGSAVATDTGAASGTFTAAVALPVGGLWQGASVLQEVIPPEYTGLLRTATTT